MAPGSEPLHEAVKPFFKHEFQECAVEYWQNILTNMGRILFHQEAFDLLYPSYGDSYPMFNGASEGMTIESKRLAAVGWPGGLICRRITVTAQAIGIEGTLTTASHVGNGKSPAKWQRLAWNEYSKFLQEQLHQPQKANT